MKAVRLDYSHAIMISLSGKGCGGGGVMAGYYLLLAVVP
jgi:hypothetical protein